MSDANEEIVVETAQVDVDPLTAYARLRSYTPGRGSFLLECRGGAGDEHRYSIVGYRVRTGEMVPPGADPYIIHGELDGQEAADTFAGALVRGVVGYFGPSAPFLHHGIPLFEGEGAAGQFNKGSVVMVFDHQQGVVTVAGRKKGKQVERCLWELEHAPEVITELGASAGDSPESLRADLEDDKLVARVRRAAPFVDDELEALVLAQTFHAPLAGSDPFDAYLAWRGLQSASIGYFIDFGQSPVAPSVQVFGFAKGLLYSQRRGQGQPRFADALHEAMPHPELVGTPPRLACKLLRRIEETARHIVGGTAGYLCPGGEAGLVLLDEVITAQADAYWHSRALRVQEDSDAESFPERARVEAAPALAAMAAAQHRASAAK